MDFLEQVFWDNTFQQWLIGLGIAVVAYAVLSLGRRVIVRRLRSFARTTSTDIDDLIADLLARTRFYFLIVIGLYFGTFALTLPDHLQKLFATLASLALLFQAGVWASGLLTYFIKRATKERTGDDAASATTFGALGFIGKIILWSVVLLLALDNLGFDITALVAGLGIGGVAIALALQSILGDLFASLSIIMDKPFVIGDTIHVDNHIGAVEHIGLKTTRVRSLSGEQIIFSNGDLLKSRIRNYKRMVERRAVFTVGVTYQTPYEKLEQIPTIMRESIERQSDTRFDRSHFQSYGDSALLFETVYYVTTPEYLRFMDVQQAVNLEIFRRFREEGIRFAYPSRTLYVETPSGPR